MISKGATTVLVLAVLVQATCGLPAPQWFSFKDGKFGVGYGGYHAEAGLGGLLTGNTAHGGLVASAGTPNGQHAGAGLGGLLDGNDRTSGGGYAGATAGHGVGASAAFGGTLNNEGSAGGLGAESHVPGTSNKVVEIGQTKSASSPGKIASVHEGELHTRFNDETSFHKKTKTVLKEVNTELQAPPAVQPQSHGYIKTVYKKKVITRPHKVHLNSRFDSNGHSSGSTLSTQTVQAAPNPNFWNDIFNIPISTLSAVNQFLNNKSNSGTAHVQKHVEIH